MRIEGPATQALQAHSTAQAVAAHNVANVSTNEFKARQTTFETGPQGQGVRVQEIRQSSAPGGAAPSFTAVEDASGRMEQVPTVVETSNTDVATETVNMISNSNAYAANAAVVRTKDEMAGTVLDMMT
jgi:flagellar basal-body rod protein FlgC